MSKRMLLVSADRCDAIEDSVKRAGWTMRRVPDGWTALSRARGETFAAFLIVPTPGAMTAETALMLRSLDTSVPIVILRNAGIEARGRNFAEVATATIPYTVVIEAKSLQHYLQSLKPSTSQPPH